MIQLPGNQLIIKNKNMPTYEYICKNCNYKFEEFQSITAAPIEICPKCSGNVKRLIGSGLGVVFKGTGFYETDFKNKKSEKKESCNKCPNSETCNNKE